VARFASSSSSKGDFEPFAKFKLLAADASSAAAEAAEIHLGVRLNFNPRRTSERVSRTSLPFRTRAGKRRRAA